MLVPALSQPSPKIVAGYHAVQFGKTMLWVAADLIAFYALASVEHVPVAALSLVLMGGLAWHAMSDLAVGQWLERRGGNAQRLAIVAGLAVPIACAAFVSSLLTAASHPWLALAAMMLSRSAYALFDVPHNALLGRMARLGWPAVRIAGLRNLWGQVASLLLGLALAPASGPTMSGIGLMLVLGMIAIVSATFTLPIVILVQRLWDVPVEAASTTSRSALHDRVTIAAVLVLHVGATLAVTTTSKVALATIAPGLALAMMSAGRIVASIPLPARWHERRVTAKLGGSAVILMLAIVALFSSPGWPSLFAFGLASGWINIFTWAWLGHATDHPRPFALAAMLGKAGMLASIPLAARMLP